MALGADPAPRDPAVGTWAIGCHTAPARNCSPNAGSGVDHVAVYRWAQRFTPLLADAAWFARHSPGAPV